MLTYNRYDWIKSHDSTRPAHYEGDFEAETVDVYSKMYPTVSSIIDFAREGNFTKPLVLCEFAHAYVSLAVTNQ